MLPGAGSGGTWAQDGYNVLGAGNPYIGGGTDFDLFGDDPLLDPSGAVPGYYFFSYDDGCNPPQQVILYINDPVDAGDDVDLDWCLGTSIPYDLNDYITGDTGGTWILSPLSDPLPGGQTIDDVAPVGNTENLADGLPNTYVFLYQVTAATPSGFEQADCGTCVSVATVTIRFIPAFNPGDGDVFIVIPETEGTFNLYDVLTGTPDSSGAWNQVSGEDTVTPGGGYFGTINLDSVAGCHYVFRYAGGFIDSEGGNCEAEFFVDITIIRDFSLTIDAGETVLNAEYENCDSPTFEWFKLNVATNEWDSLGVTTQDYTMSSPVDGDEFKVVLTCGDCTQEAIHVYTSNVCANNPCFDIIHNETTDCLSVVNNGTNTSPVSTDVIQWKKDGGLYATYTGPICGCDFYEYLNVVPYCLVVGANIRVGYSSFTACPTRVVGRVYVEYGDGTDEVHTGTNITADYVQWTPAQWIAKGRTAVFRIRCLTPIGYIFKMVQFTYTGSGGLTCSDVTYAHLNYPKLYYKIWFKRTVDYSDTCATVICENFFEIDNGCLLEAFLTTANISNPPIYTGPGIAASAFNASGSQTYAWYKNGVLLAGETLTYIPTTYGNGVYTVVVTDIGCTATDTLVLSSGCTIGVSVQLSGTTLTATVSGCGASPITYQWAFWTGSAWSNLGTASTQAVTVSGQYRVLATCGGCTAEFTYTYTVPCSISVEIVVTGNNLQAVPSGCTGAEEYLWQVWNGSGWDDLDSTDFWDVTVDGLYRVVLTCDGCTAIAQYNFVTSCASSVTISISGGPINPTMTANPSGCVGAPTYQWHRFFGGVWTALGTASTEIANVANRTYRVTMVCDGCTSYDYYYYTGCSTTVAITLTGGGTTLTATPTSCGGTASYVWEISLNGGASWAVIAPTTATITPAQSGLYRVTLTCSGTGCTAQDTETFTFPCATTLSLNYALGTLTATTGGCAGVLAIYWQYSPNYDPLSGGCTGWTQVATGVTSYVPTVTGCYRVVTTCDGSCFQERTLYVVIANPCAGITMSITPGIGKVSWGTLNLSGVPMTNYLISWRTSPGDVEVFQSGAGSYYNALTMYPHPSSNIPLPVGAYYPYILFSDAGDDLDCLPVFNVDAVVCGTDYGLTYSGPGGVAATQSVSVAVDAGTGYIKIGIQTQTVADKVQVRYNSVIIFDSGNITTGFAYQMFVVPITFVPSQNYAEVIVTNSTPAQQTNFRLYINCCTTLSSCPLVLDTTAITAALNTSCGCVFTNVPTYQNFYPDLFSSLCQNVDSYAASYLMQAGGCGVSYLPGANLVCVDCGSTVVSKPIGIVGVRIVIPFPCSTRYASIKARLLSITDPDTFVDIQFKNSACVGDGSFTTVKIWPAHGTMTFDDVTRTIQYNMAAVNPYTNTCTDCETLLYTAYENYLNLYSNPGNPVFGTFQSIYSDRAVTAAPLATADIFFNEIIVSDCGTTERRYKIDYRNDDCPCASWQLWEDVTLTGLYTTLISQAAGWGGSCP
jgi:hypothetical protein